MCIEKLSPVWNRWSHSYLLNGEEVELYAHVPGGNKLVTGDRCIFEFFLKKSRSSTAAPKYDFSSVLEVLLQLSGSFYERVNEHRLMKESGLEVCRLNAP